MCLKCKFIYNPSIGHYKLEHTVTSMLIKSLLPRSGLKLCDDLTSNFHIIKYAIPSFRRLASHGWRPRRLAGRVLMLLLRCVGWGTSSHSCREDGLAVLPHLWCRNRCNLDSILFFYCNRRAKLLRVEKKNTPSPVRYSTCMTNHQRRYTTDQALAGMMADHQLGLL